jgi:predicted TIM-barrel fold metal-dependent hydrolase
MEKGMAVLTARNPCGLTEEARYLVISADTHGGTKAEAFRPYLDAQYREDFDAWFKTAYPPFEKWFYDHFDQVTKTWGNEGDGQSSQAFYKKIELGISDASTRIRALEADGQVGSVIYPGASVLSATPFANLDAVRSIQGGTVQGGKGPSREQTWAGAWAYTRWIADYCSEYPHQLAGVMQIPDWSDMDQVVSMVRWGAEHGLRGGINMPGLNLDVPGLHARYWDSLWSLCEEYGLPVNNHAGYTMDPRIYGPNSDDLQNLIATASRHHWRTLPIPMLMLGGVVERHPKLKIVFSEQYADWVPDEIEELEHWLRDRPGTYMIRETLSLSLRQYWERNFAVGASFMTPKEARMRHQIGLGTIMWGSDYPHPESTYPFTRESLRLSFHEVPPDELSMILGGNAARVYGFDLAKLAPIADRVGPTVAELQEPLTVAPKGFLRWSLRPDQDKDLVKQHQESRAGRERDFAALVLG